MKALLAIFIIIPFAGFVTSLLLPSKNENLISKVTFTTAGLQLMSALGFLGFWAFAGFPILNVKEFALYESGNYEFFIDLYFDRISATYLLVGAILTFLITTYSRYYLHREKGYKRFFNTILFFYLGYNITIFSGNFETLFIGWEILGISSFLLIAFYRDRYLPVRNAMKVFSIYRLGDIGLILAMWMSHHLWHHNVTFEQLNNYQLVDSAVNEHIYIGIFISLMVLMASAVKSAQFPFSSWLPRAMEGPTPSSAIFYSSLSVHIGVFILLRTFSFWEHLFVVRVIIGVLGLVTSVVATFSGRVQSSIKSQIAYSAIAQIGIIFIEVAMGWEVLALIHFAGNAFLRTYQLLVSPSVVTYLIREQFFNFQPEQKSNRKPWMKKLQNSIYVFSVREWNLDSLMFRYLWNPFKRLGGRLSFISVKSTSLLFVPLFMGGIFLIFNEELISDTLLHQLPTVFAFAGLLFVLKAFTERKNVVFSWWLVVFNHFWIALAVSFNEHFDFWHTGIYLSGVVVSGIGGYLCLLWLKRREPNIHLNGFQGHSYEYPVMAFVFLLACLGLAGFPITTTFLGEDLIYSHIHETQVFLVLFSALSFIFDGLTLIRIYSRVFMGPHEKTYHEVAYRSS